MIALISDIHGNFEALTSVLKKLDEMKIDEIYCLGDVIGYYSQVNECCEELQKRNIKCVLGNHDYYMISETYCPRSHSVNDCLAYQRKIITKQNKEWLASFPVYRTVHGIAMVHGGWANPIDEYLDPDEHYFDAIEGLRFASGHSHIQQIRVFGDKIWCNPGAVGQPRDGNNRAAFATYDGTNFELHRVSYNIKRVGELMEKAGFNPYYYGCLNDASRNLHR